MCCVSDEAEIIVDVMLTVESCVEMSCKDVEMLCSCFSESTLSDPQRPNREAVDGGAVLDSRTRSIHSFKMRLLGV